MTTVTEMIDAVKAELRDQYPYEVSIDQLTIMINNAVMDARNQGTLIYLEDDESIVFVANTFEYAVPASFAWVSSLRVENTNMTPSTWDEEIPHHQWSIRLDGGVPKFFLTIGFPLAAGKKMKVIGQARPATYSSPSATIQIGLESFIRERVLASALGFAAATEPSLDALRLNLRMQHLQMSERMLGHHPGEFRVSPNSEYVPSR